MPTLLTGPEFQFGEREIFFPPFLFQHELWKNTRKWARGGGLVWGVEGHLLFLLKKEQLPQISQNGDLGGGRGRPFGHLQTEDYWHLTLRSASFSGFVWQQLKYKRLTIKFTVVAA